MITAVQKNEIYIISFQYDTEIIRLVKNVPGSWWHADKKYWTIPADRIGFFLAQLKGTPYENQITVYSDEHIDENATLDPTVGIPDVDLTGIPLYVENGSHLFQHQLDFLKYAIYRQRHISKSGFLLADQMGTGKTLSAMNLALYNKKFNGVKHCLVVVCVNSAKFNWVADIEKHTNGEYTPYLLGSRKRRDGTVKSPVSSTDKLDDLLCGHMYGKKEEDPLPYFIVINVEAFHFKQNRRYPIRERLTTLINKGYIGMVIIDEAHTGLSASSKQGQQMIKLKTDTAGANVEWLPMTGTPIMNKPTDLYTPLRLIDAHHFKNYYSWCQYFCVYGGFGNHNIIAYKNIPELKKILQYNMLRRLKKDTLDLPPKIHNVEYVENTPYQQKLYDMVLKDVKDNKSRILTAPDPRVMLLKLRQVNGSPELVDPDLTIDRSYITKNTKLLRLLELVDTIVSNDEKVVIFSNWVEPLRTIYKFLAVKYKVCSYTGTMDQDVREEHKQRFQVDPEYKIMLGTIKALGTTHTLTAANNVIFYDLPWNPATMEQAEDRCHRTGTVSTVNIYSIISKDTVDERVYNIIMQKDMMSKYIVDDELDLNGNPRLLDYILGSNSNLV